MSDIYLGIAASLLMSALCCAAGAWVGKRVPRWIATMLIVGGIGFLLLHAVVLSDNVRLVNFLPVSALIVVGNLTPLATGWIAGLGWRVVPGKFWRKSALIVPMMGTCFYTAYAPVMVQVPMLGDRWDFGVCRQTSNESCSAAAAATLLSEHGIVASEQEMARLCLTSKEGTSMLGLYRGLMLKTRGSSWSVVPFEGTLDDLRMLGGQAVVSVGLKPNQIPDPTYSKEWGWEPGVKHTIVIFEFDGRDGIAVGDPNAGREHWTANDLRMLWYGEGFRLVRRRSGP